MDVAPHPVVGGVAKIFVQEGLCFQKGTSHVISTGLISRIVFISSFTNYIKFVNSVLSKRSD
jgi:hypothetical protein